MSKKVDERVVEMRFDNKDFESNVKTTMSTLDRLKAALKLPSSSKAFEGVSNAAKNSTSNISGMGAAVETVNARFSALQVVGMTALSNITTAAMRAGSNLVKSFTLDPIISGFQEYETQLNSVQTILANTSSKGTTIEDVTAALDELNTYADQTIYNFTEMTRNIGTFTAAGVDLDTSVSAIKGIANLAAVSGSSSQQASTAMYQLSQALAAGRVSLMDWNSVVNAGMGGEVFQNALKRTAEVMGKDVDALIEKYGSFRESLTSGEWLTTDVLTKTLEQFTMAAEEGSAEWDKFKASLMEQGYTEAQAVEILKMANTATDAATKVKTFTQMMDTLKEAMGSGWAKTWQLIFGDFEEAREFWTHMSEGLGDMINKFSDARNNVIAAAMGGGESRWGEFTAELDKAGVSLDSFQSKLAEVYSASSGGGSLDELITQYGSLEKAIGSGEISAEMITQTLNELAGSTDNASQSMKDLAQWQKVVDDVWRGDYGNIDTGRMEKLAAAGWEYAEVQKLVNQTVDGHRLTLEDLSAAQIESMGYTKEQAEALATLAEEASKSGGTINDLITDITTPKRSGRELFLEGLENTITAIIKPLQALAGAFGDVFGMNADQLYNLIEGFNEFSKAIVISDEDAANLRSTFKGLFSIVHILATGFGKTLILAFKAANAILAPFGTNVLEVTGFLGELIYQFDEWVTSGTIFEDMLNGLSDAVSWLIEPLRQFWDSLFPDDITMGANNPITVVVSAIESLRSYIDSFSGLSVGEVFGKLTTDVKTAFITFGTEIQNAFNKLKGLSWNDVLKAAETFGNKFRETFEKLKTKFEELAPDIIEGFQNGLKEGWDKVTEFLSDVATKIIEVVKAVLGIHSPSTVFFEIGKNIVEGLIGGIKYLSGQVSDVIYSLVEDIKYALSGVDWAAVFTVGAGVGSFIVLYQLTDALQTFATGVKGFSAPFQSAANILDTTNNFLKKLTDGNSSSKGFKNVADGIKVLAEAIAILVASVGALTLIDPGKMWTAIAAIGALAAIIGVLAIALSKFADGGTVLDSLQLNSTLLSLGVAFGLFAVSARILGGMDATQIDGAKEMLLTFAGIVSVLVLISQFGNKLDSVAAVLSKVGIAFILLAAASKLMGGMDRSQMDAAQEMLVTFMGIISVLMLIAQVGGKSIGKASAFLSQIGTAFVLLGVASRLLGGMDRSSMDSAQEMLLMFMGVVSVLMLVAQVGGKSIGKAFQFLSQIGTAFLMLSVAARLLGGMSEDEMKNAQNALLGFVGVVSVMLIICRLLGGGEMAKIGTSLLSMSLSIGILAGIAVLLSYVDPAGLTKGIIAVGALALLVTMMTKATQGATDVKGTMMGIAVAIGVMAASIAVLSLLDSGKVAIATACMSAVMGMFALIVKMGSNVQTSMGIMLVMVAAIGVMAAAIGILAQMPWQNTLASATGLSAVLLALAAACKILGSVNSVAPMALVAAGILTALVGVIAFILVQMNGIDPIGALANATALSTVLLAFSAATLILSKIGAGAMAAVQGAGALVVVIAAVTAVLAAIGGINELLGGGVETALDGAIRIMEKIGEAIGSFISGIGVGLTSGLPEIAQNLSLFAVGLTPFIVSMKMIDATLVDSATSLAGAILALTASNVIDGIASLFGMSAFDGLGEKFAQLGSALGNFADATAGVDGPTTAIAAQALAAICTAMSSIPNTGGLLEGLFGSQDFSGFATGMEDLGKALKAFNDATTGITPETIQPAAESLKTVIEALGGVPNSGGLLGDIIGGKDYSGFAEGMKSIGTALKSFYDATSQISDFEKLNTASQALKTVIDVLSTIPNSGGLLGDLLGGKDYAGFAEGMKSIGDALYNFNGSVSQISDFEKLNTATSALKSVIETLSTIPAEGGWLDNIFGDGSINYENFSNALTGIGDALSDYSGSVGEIDSEKIGQSITTLRDVINVMQLYSNSSDIIESGIENADKMSDLGDALKDYSDSIASVDPAKVSSSATAITNLKNTINDLVGIDSGGIEAFQNAINQLAQTNVQALIDAFEGLDLSAAGRDIMGTLAAGIQEGTSQVTRAAKAISDELFRTLRSRRDDFSKAGTDFIKELSRSIGNGRSTVNNSIRTALSSASGVIRSYRSTFYNAGAYISAGMAAGMESSLSRIRTAASNMVRAASAATTARAMIASPSRLFMRYGAYMGEGLAIGMENETRTVYNAGALMGDSAYDGIKTTISKMSSILNNDLDVNPTIRPVMDLSEIQNGADYINNTLGNLAPVSTLSRVNSIDRSMNSRLQNGSFDDVVGAIERLRFKLDDISKPSYNINGITYDDGSAIASAVESLVRATRIERRV